MTAVVLADASAESATRDGEPAAVDAALSLVLTRGMSIRAAVGMAMAAHPLSEDDLHAMARIGLQHVVADKLSDARGTDAMVTMRARFGFEGRALRKPADRLADILATIVLEGAEGGQKALADFRLVDCQHIHADASARITAWTRRRDFAALAIATLGDDHERTLGEVKGPAAHRLRELAAEAWGGTR